MGPPIRMAPSLSYLIPRPSWTSGRLVVFLLDSQRYLLSLLKVSARRSAVAVSNTVGRGGGTTRSTSAGVPATLAGTVVEIALLIAHEQTARLQRAMPLSLCLSQDYT